MQPNRKIGEKQDEMGRPLGKNGCKQTSRESRGGKHQGRRKRGRPQLRWEDCVRRDMGRSGKEERWREGAADKKTMERKNGKSGSTILYLTLTPVQQGTRRKSTFISLCEKENFLVSHLHCSLTNAALCPLVLLPSLSLKNIFLSTSSKSFTILNTSMWSPLSLLVCSVVKPHCNKRLS